MNKDELIRMISNDIDVKQYLVKKVLNGLVRQTKNALISNNKVYISGLGTFTVISPRPRNIKNIQTKEIEYITPKRKIKFSPSESMKEAVNNEL